jgi:hypothetical protein
VLRGKEDMGKKTGPVQEAGMKKKVSYYVQLLQEKGN